MTFLFTDLEGSTGLWERDSAAMDDVLRVHDQVLNECITTGGGVVFSRAGDSFAAAFPFAANALMAAAEVQRRIAAIGGPVLLRVRIGVHCGEAFERDGDYFGPVVNRAARLMAAAHGGQTVCSLVVAELARPALPPELTLVELGTHRLKDLLAPETVLQLNAPDVETSFPPLRTLDVAHHNLPVQQTRLIGRDADVARIAAQLVGSRLVTLTGIGGCGKTRLALAIAAELAPTAADGVFFVGLATVTNGAAVVDAVTQSMGVRLTDPGVSGLAAHLAGRDALLVLDNCEHLLDEVTDLVDALLATTTRLRLLTTSREALGAAGEHVVRVASLTVDDQSAPLGRGRQVTAPLGPERDHVDQGDGPPEQSPAVALLVERARAAGADVAVSPGNRSVLEDICRRLDGIPLAIELAAAQLDVLTPVDLLARLDHRFDLLVGGHGRRRQRQQTLQAMMDWSWELLSSSERTLLGVVSVFTGSWALDAIEATAASFVGGPVTVALRSLVAKSLVEPVFSVGRSRFRLLETVRMFAAAQLVELGLVDEARHAHADFYVQRSLKIGGDRAFLEEESLDDVSTDLTDIDAVIEHCINRSAWEQAAQLTVFTGGCRMVGLASANGVRWVSLIEPHIEDDIIRAQMFATGGYAGIASGQHDITRSWERKALAFAGRDPFALVLAGCLRAAPLMLGEPDEARTHLLDALDTADRGTPQLRGFARLWTNTARLTQPTIDLPFFDDQDPEQFGGLGAVAYLLVRYIGAIRLAEEGSYDRAIKLLPNDNQLLRDDRNLEKAVYRIAVEAIAGDPATALDLARAGLDAVNRSSDVIWHGELAVVVGIALNRNGRSGDAVEHFEAAKRSPMAMPYWYALARRFGRNARNRLDPADAERSVATGRRLSVDALLQRDLTSTHGSHLP